MDKLNIEGHLLTVTTINKATGEKTVYNRVIDINHYHGYGKYGYGQYFTIWIMEKGKDVHHSERVRIDPYTFDIGIKLGEEQDGRQGENAADNPAEQ